MGVGESDADGPTVRLYFYKPSRKEDFRKNNYFATIDHFFNQISRSFSATFYDQSSFLKLMDKVCNYVKETPQGDISVVRIKPEKNPVLYDAAASMIKMANEIGSYKSIIERGSKSAKNLSSIFSL